MHLLLSHKNQVGVQQWYNYSDFLKPVLWILTSFWSILAGKQHAKLEARGYGRQLRKGENTVALLEEPFPFLSKKKDGEDMENGKQGAVGHLYRAFGVYFLSKGTLGHLASLPKPTAFDKLLGVL